MKNKNVNLHELRDKHKGYRVQIKSKDLEKIKTKIIWHGRFLIKIFFIKLENIIFFIQTRKYYFITPTFVLKSMYYV